MSDINSQDKVPLTCSFTTRVKIHGVEGELAVADGTLKQIREAVEALPTIRGVELVQEAKQWTTCLYERFAPAEARRIASKLEWHYTPEHGSWLNMAECELAVLSSQCLNRRIPDRATLEREVAARWG